MQKILIWCCVVLFFGACKKEDQQALDRIAQEEIIISDYLKENNINAQKTSDGIYYFFQTQNNGLAPKLGDSVAVHYTGNLLYGKIFDSSRFRDKAFGTRVGVSKVIEGWHKVLPLMKKGEKATFIIPSRWAYGLQGQKSNSTTYSIPPNSVLVFEIEMLDIFPQ